MMDTSRLRFISNRSGTNLKDLVVKYFAKNLEQKNRKPFLASQPNNVKAKHFPSGEVYPRLVDNARRKNVHAIFSFHNPNLYMMKKTITRSNIDFQRKAEIIEEYINSTESDFREATKILDSARRSGVNEISFYLTQFPDARQDKKDESRVPISASLNLKNLIHSAEPKVGRIGAVDLHSKQIQGMDVLPFDEIRCTDLFYAHMRYTMDSFEDVVMLLVDAGSYKRYAKDIELFKLTYGFVPKAARTEHNRVNAGKYNGPDLKDKIVVMLDDMVDTGGTIDNALTLAEKQGAKETRVYAAHGILGTEVIRDKKTKKATEIKYAEDKFKGRNVKFYFSDSVARNKEYLKEHKDWIQMFTIAPFISDLIYCNETGSSHGEIIDRFRKIAQEGKKKELKKEIKRYFIY